MADRISILPDAVLCYILSFLPTKVSVSTCVLSKRWQYLWRSVPTFDFDYCRDSEHIQSWESFNCNFVSWMDTFLRSRDPLQSLQNFSLTHVPLNFYYRMDYPSNTLESVFAGKVKHKLEHLDLFLECPIDVPFVILRCKTLVALKLLNLNLIHFSSVDLPSLKVMCLHNASIAEHRFLADFLSGCPNLEDMEVYGPYTHITSYATEARFKKLPKLVRAVIMKDLFPLEVVSNVHFLRIEKIDGEKVKIVEDLIPHFYNLTSIEFRNYYKNWLDVFKMLNHCPKLQHIFIDQVWFRERERGWKEYNSSWDWQCPPDVPKCLSSHLKTCRVRNYAGGKAEFEFVRYIMQNERVLENMTISTNKWKEGEFEKGLSLCRRLSSTCTLSFEYVKLSFEYEKMPHSWFW